MLAGLGKGGESFQNILPIKGESSQHNHVTLEQKGRKAGMSTLKQIHDASTSVP